MAEPPAHVESRRLRERDVRLRRPHVFAAIVLDQRSRNRVLPIDVATVNGDDAPGRRECRCQHIEQRRRFLVGEVMQEACGQHDIELTELPQRPTIERLGDKAAAGAPACLRARNIRLADIEADVFDVRKNGQHVRSAAADVEHPLSSARADELLLDPTTCMRTTKEVLQQVVRPSLGKKEHRIVRRVQSSTPHH